MLLYRQNTPVLLYRWNTPVLLYRQNTPVLLYRQNTPVLLYRWNTPVLLYRQNTPVLLYRRNTPVLLYRQNTPVLLYRQNTPVHCCTDRKSLCITVDPVTLLYYYCVHKIFPLYSLAPAGVQWKSDQKASCCPVLSALIAHLQLLPHFNGPVISKLPIKMMATHTTR